MRSVSRLPAIAVLCAAAALLASCGLGEAKTRGEELVEAHDAARQAGDLDRTIALYGGPAFAEVSRAQWRETLLEGEQTLGSLVDRSLRRWDVSQGDKGLGPGIYVTLDYRAEYATQTVDEQFLIYMPEDGAPPRIVGHHVRS